VTNDVPEFLQADFVVLTHFMSKPCFMDTAYHVSHNTAFVQADVSGLDMNSFDKFQGSRVNKGGPAHNVGTSHLDRQQCYGTHQGRH
jgi:hypothetical protein